MNYSKKETSKKQKALRSKKKKVGKKLSVIFLKAFLVCMIAVVVIVGCAGVGIVKGVIDNAPDITSESVIPKGYKSTVYDADGNKMQELIASGTNRTMVTIDQIPKHVQDAFIAIEDERFYEHNGIDIQGIARAGVTFVTSGFKTMQGASTITQQLLKNNVFDFMSEDGLADKIERKIQEQYLAIELEKTMSKAEILQAYLNTINLSQNTLGVQAASNRYFGKDVSELSLAEAAVLAGITKEPEKYNPIRNQEENEKRRSLVLNNMLEQGLISQKEYESAMKEDVYSHIKNVNETVEQDTKVNSYFTDAVVQSVLEDLKELKGYSDTQAYNMLYGGGLKIYTTMDPKLQGIMDEELANPKNFPETYKIGLEYAMTTVKADGTTTNYSQEMMQAYFKEKTGKKYELLYANEEKAQEAIDEYEATVIEKGDTVYRNVKMTIQPQVSMVLMDQYTGEVKGILGGRGEKTGNLTLNRATDAVRPPGSTFKVLAAYAPALDAANMSLATTQYDGPYIYEQVEEPRLVKNWDGTAYDGWTSIRKGIEASMNILAVKTYTQNGSALGLSYLDKFGFTTIQKKANENGLNDYGPSVALGGLTNGVKNIELTGAYAAIANAGVYQEPIFYTKVEDFDGNVIIDKTASRKTNQVVSPENAWLLTNAMKDVITGATGTGKAVNFGGMTLAGKTGTATDEKDLWFVGYSPYYTCGVWAGYDKQTKLTGDEKNYHKRLWKSVMSRVHEDLENKDFEKPEDIVQVQVCAKSGLLPVPGLCDTDLRGPQIVTEYFAKGFEPTETCNVHIMAKVCHVTGLLATDECYWPAEQSRVILPVLQEGAPDDPTLDTAFGVSMLPQYTCTVCTGGAQLQAITVTENFDLLQSVTAARAQ